jgi:hypothetical protein
MTMTLRRTAPALAAAALLLLNACSSVPPPDDAMAAARLALQRAEATEAPREAPVELQQARDKLTEAEKAIVAEEYTTARRLAQEAAADAQFAEAQAERAVAHRNRQQVESAIGALAPGAPMATTSQPMTSSQPTTSATPLAPPASGGMQ